VKGTGYLSHPAEILRMPTNPPIIDKIARMINEQSSRGLSANDALIMVPLVSVNVTNNKRNI
jgi:hypothetical protein